MKNEINRIICEADMCICLNMLGMSFCSRDNEEKSLNEVFNRLSFVSSLEELKFVHQFIQMSLISLGIRMIRSKRRRGSFSRLGSRINGFLNSFETF